MDTLYRDHIYEHEDDVFFFQSEHIGYRQVYLFVVKKKDSLSWPDFNQVYKAVTVKHAIRFSLSREILCIVANSQKI